MKIGSILSIFAVAVLPACQQGFVVTQAEYDSSKSGFTVVEELPGFPVQSTELKKITGEFTAHTLKIGCNNRAVEKFVRAPVENRYYFISPPQGLFSGHKLAFELHEDGSLKSMNSEAPSIASDIAGVVSDLGVVSKITDDGAPPCNTNFVADLGQL